MAEIQFKREGNQVTLVMSVDEWENLLLALGYAAGAALPTSRQFWQWIDLANRLNAGNPNFTPYEIPERFRSGAKNSP